MGARVISLVVVVVALVGYHVSQRSMPAAIKSPPLFAFVYGVAMTAMLMILAVGAATGSGSSDGSSSNGDGGQLRLIATSWAPWLLAVSVASIELGVLAMYRSGWELSTAALTSQSLAIAVLVIIGVFAFGEHLTPGRIVGLVLCAAGVGLLSR